MKGKDEIKDLFSDKLGNFEAPVRPDLWTNIASQIGAGSTTVVTTSLSLLTKTIIAIGVGAAVVTTVILLSPKTELNPTKNSSINSAETKISEPIVKVETNVSQENVRMEDEKTTIKTVETNPQKTIELAEIDKDETFKFDITLLDALKESQADKSTEKKEEPISNVKNEKVVEKPRVESLNEDKKSAENIQPKVSEEKPAEEKEVTAYTLSELPNVFTPNGDGNNDILFIESEGLLDFTVVVLDSKQKVVFESNDPNFKWNGVDKYGNTVKAGSYIYFIVARDKNGNQVNKYVTLEVRL